VLSDALNVMLIPILIGLAFSFVLEQLHQPRPPLPWQRRPGYLMIHSGLWLLLYLIEFVQFGRPWLALCLTSTIFYVLVLINHAKFNALREPFIYQDFEYFLDMLKHPRLYLPFFGFLKILLCLAAVGLALWLGLSLETALWHSFSVEQVWVAGGVVLSCAIAMLLVGHRYASHLSYAPLEDFKSRGLFALFWHYAWAIRGAPALADIAQQSTLGLNPLTETQQKLYDTVVVQSESFFDPRRAFNMIEPNVLSSFDQACQASVMYGTLTVPAWGANTVRTEFSFLTGIDTAILGVDQFNPYRRLVSSGLPSLARAFKKRGYRTVCIHPYPASFYQRDKIFNLLGFDEFIDLKSFAQAVPHDKSQDKDQGQGPYVSDHVLTDKILETLDRQDEQPLFIFAITMENHGPLHLEQISIAEEQTWLSKPLPQDCQELAIYLRHLANADQMIFRLLSRFSTPLAANQDSIISSHARPVQLLWYGDHVPVLANVYAQFGFPEGDTDYFLWRSDTLRDSAVQTSQHMHRTQPMHVHQLALELLK
jgi:hypothetical protein